MNTYKTFSEAETITIIENFVRNDLGEPNSNHATVLALRGDLGSGKTFFVRHIAQNLEIDSSITSPTFVIAKFYPIVSKRTEFTTLIHIDAYRLESADELEKLGWSKWLENPHNLICIEWPERVNEIVPKHARQLRFTFLDEDTRVIEY